MRIHLLFNLITSKSFYQTTPHTIKDLFMSLDIEKAVKVIGHEKVFLESDLPFVYFLVKHFTEKDNFKKDYALKPPSENFKFLRDNLYFPLVSSTKNPLSLLLLSNQKNGNLENSSEEDQIFIRQEDLATMNSRVAKKVLDKYSDKPYLNTKSPLYSELDLQTVSCDDLYRYTKSGNINARKMFIKYLQNNIGEAYKYLDFLEKDKCHKIAGILGEIYFFGIGVEKNILNAKHYFEIGAQSNNLMCLNGLGRYYMLPDSQNHVLSHKNYLRSHYRGSHEGTYFYKMLNQKLYSRKTMEDNTYPENINYLPLKLELSDKYVFNAQFDKSNALLCEILQKGKEFKEIENKALEMFQKGKKEECFIFLMFLVELGHKESMLNLIYFHFDKIRKSSLLKRIIWGLESHFETKRTDFLGNLDFDRLFFKTLKNLGNVHSSTVLGYLYKKGLGTINDTSLSMYYYMDATIKNSNEGKFYLSFILLKLPLGFFNIEKGLRLLKQIKIYNSVFNFVYIYGLIYVYFQFILHKLSSYFSAVYALRAFVFLFTNFIIFVTFYIFKKKYVVR